jgi:hypothetical protein
MLAASLPRPSINALFARNCKRQERPTRIKRNAAFGEVKVENTPPFRKLILNCQPAQINMPATTRTVEAHLEK